MAKGPLERYRAMLARGELREDAAQAAAAARLDRLHEDLKSYEPGRAGFFARKPRPVPRGLYLWADVGRGKSMLMDLFHEGAPARRKRRVHFHAFMLEAHARIKAWRDLEERERKRRLKALGLPARTGDDPLPPVARAIADEAWLLSFDELQVHDVADAMILGRLFEQLFAFGVVTVATSNRPPADLYQGGLNRQLFEPFIDLIGARLEVVELDGPTDFRLERLEGMPIYYTPLGPGARAQMDEAWTRMTDGAASEPCALHVQGRMLEVPCTAKGVARFTFADLCARPLGAADYLEIARTFHTVLIDDIPRLSPDKRNEAKRFVTLIDALYEARVKLIASADAPPADLYPAGDGSFEFARTASRLIEMQSHDYMALPHSA